MSQPLAPDTILAHPALAGRTLYVRAGRRWTTHDIHPAGELGRPRPTSDDPAEHAWRGGPLR